MSIYNKYGKPIKIQVPISYGNAKIIYNFICRHNSFKYLLPYSLLSHSQQLNSIKVKLKNFLSNYKETGIHNIPIELFFDLMWLFWVLDEKEEERDLGKTFLFLFLMNYKDALIDTHCVIYILPEIKFDKTAAELYRKYYRHQYTHDTSMYLPYPPKESVLRRTKTFLSETLDKLSSILYNKS